MDRATTLVLAGMGRTAFPRIAMAVWLVDVFVQVAVASGDVALRWAVFAHVCAVWMAGQTWGMQLRQQGVRSGVRLIPGQEAHVLRTTTAVFLALVALPLVLAVGSRDQLTVLALSTAFPLGLSFLQGMWSRADSKSRLFVFGALLTLLGGLADAFQANETGRDVRLSLPGGHSVDALLVGQVSSAVGVVVLVAVLVWFARRVEDRWPFARTSAGGGAAASGSCDDLDGAARFARFLPPFMRRRVRRRPAPPVMGVADLRRQWMQSGSPTNSWALAVFIVPAVFVLSMFVSDGEGMDAGFFVLLFTANGLVSFGAIYTRARMRREWLRPAPRDVLLRSFASAFAREYVTYVAVVWVATLVGVVLADPSQVDSVAFWGPFLLAPAVCAWGVPLAFVTARLGRYGGILAFMIVWVSSVAFLVFVEETERAARLVPWLAAVAVALVAAVATLPLARRVWRDVEVG